jgi:CheY-like chemotaxis protein
MFGFGGSKKPKILLVDDDRFMLSVIKSYLPAEQYDIITAADGVQACDLAYKEMPVLILLDANMPEKDGWATLVDLRDNEKTAAIPVLMCTSVDDVGSLDQAFQLGAKGYVTKPVDKEKLLKKIAKTLGTEAAAAA